MMVTEQRYSARHPLDLPVYIRYRKRPFLTAKACNLSAAGMFLSVKALTLPTGTPIELELRAHGKRWLLPAIVTHGDNSGIGVMFQGQQDDLFQELVNGSETPMPPLMAGGAQPVMRA
jgi:hypothetical protein